MYILRVVLHLPTLDYLINTNLPVLARLYTIFDYMLIHFQIPDYSGVKFLLYFLCKFYSWVLWNVKGVLGCIINSITHNSYNKKSSDKTLLLNSVEKVHDVISPFIITWIQKFCMLPNCSYLQILHTEFSG